MDAAIKPKVNHGKNIRRVRELSEISQEALAFDLGITQQNLSHIEKKEKIEDETLAKIAEALKINVKFLKEFPEENAVNVFYNTFNEQSTGSFSSGDNSTTNINPVINTLDGDVLNLLKDISKTLKDLKK